MWSSGEIVIINKEGIRSIKKRQGGPFILLHLAESVYSCKAQDSVIDAAKCTLVTGAISRLFLQKNSLIDADLLLQACA